MSLLLSLLCKDYFNHHDETDFLMGVGTIILKQEKNCRECFHSLKQQRLLCVGPCMLSMKAPR